jgi:sec1 family domain-containing protein 1
MSHHSGSRGLTLRHKQREVLVDIIQSAVPMDSFAGSSSSSATSAANATSSSWKLLVFDSVGRDMIAPLLKVKDLREMGVTLHMMIDKQREPVPGAPAIYLCAPTEDNITKIAKDCVQELYQWVYVNFTAPIHRKLLETFAELLTAEGKLRSIRHIRVVDRTLSFVALANDQFSLMMPRTLYTLNSRHTTDAAMEVCLTQISQGLSHAVISTQQVPVVAFAKGGAAEEVGKRVVGTIHDLLKERIFTPQTTSAALGRPLLLITDRTTDLPCALHHPFSYRGLLVDAMGMRLNKVDMNNEGKEKTFEMDPENDAFFRSNASVDFGSVASNVEAALEEYKKEVDRFSRDNGGGNTDGSDASTMSKMLAHAPKLAEKKRSLDAHTTLAYGILKSIKESELDGFHGVEAGVMNREGVDHEHFEKLMTGPTSLQDKQRMYLIAYLLSHNDEEAAALEKYLPYCAQPAAAQSPAAASGAPSAPGTSATGNRFPALQYIKHLRSWSLHANSPATQSASSSSLTSGWGFAQSLAKGIAATLKGSSEAEYALTRLVDALLQDSNAISGAAGGRSSAAAARSKLLEGLGAMDPRSRQAVDAGDIHFHHAIVFVVGGGSVNEYDNLKRWESTHPRKSVAYGSTEMLRGHDVLQELTMLGAE